MKKYKIIEKETNQEVAEYFSEEAVLQIISDFEEEDGEDFYVVKISHECDFCTKEISAESRFCSKDCHIGYMSEL